MKSANKTSNDLHDVESSIQSRISRIRKLAAINIDGKSQKDELVKWDDYQDWKDAPDPSPWGNWTK